MTGRFVGSSPGQAIPYVSLSARRWYFSYTKSAYVRLLRPLDGVTQEDERTPSAVEDLSQQTGANRFAMPDTVLAGADLAREIREIPVKLKLLAGRFAPNNLRIVAFWIDSELDLAASELDAILPPPSVDGPEATSNSIDADRSRGRKLAAQLVHEHPSGFSDAQREVLAAPFDGTAAE